VYRDGSGIETVVLRGLPFPALAGAPGTAVAVTPPGPIEATSQEDSSFDPERYLQAFTVL
jgi:hypothetical protein